MNLPFLSSPLAFVPIYIWSRRHPSTPISLFGLITITAPYLPFALVCLAWMLNGTWRAAAGDLMGCAVGHVAWFVRDVWTREMVGGSTWLSDAPLALWVVFFSSYVNTPLTATLSLQETASRRCMRSDTVPKGLIWIGPLYYGVYYVWQVYFVGTMDCTAAACPFSTRSVRQLRLASSRQHSLPGRGQQ